MIRVGDTAELTRVFAGAEVAEHVALCGDPAGTATAAAAASDAVTDTTHDTANVPPALIGALFSCLLGVRLPGPGTNYLKQSTRFPAAAPTGEPLTARVVVTRLRPGKRLVDLETTCRDARGCLVAEGRALVRWDGLDERVDDGG